MPRPKGSKNRQSSYARLLLLENGCNPILDTLKCANELYKEGQIKDAGKLYSDLIPYIAPKLSSVEVTGDEESPLSFNISIGGTSADQVQQ